MKFKILNEASTPLNPEGFQDVDAVLKADQNKKADSRTKEQKIKDADEKQKEKKEKSNQNLLKKISYMAQKDKGYLNSLDAKADVSKWLEQIGFEPPVKNSEDENNDQG